MEIKAQFIVDDKVYLVHDPVVVRIIQKFIARSEVGIAKYGKTLADSTDNMLQHLQEELMDASLYIEAQKKWKVVYYAEGYEPSEWVCDNHQQAEWVKQDLLTNAWKNRNAVCPVQGIKIPEDVPLLFGEPLEAVLTWMAAKDYAEKLTEIKIEEA